MASASAGENRPACIAWRQVDAIDEFHQQKVEMLGVPEIVNGDDVRVVQAREHAALAVEALGKTRVLRQLVGKQFQRDEAIEMRLAGLEDETHAAPANKFENLKLREGGGDAFERWNLRGGRRCQTGLGAGGGAGEDALRAEASGRIGRHGRLAFRTTARVGISAHTPVS